MNNVKNIRELLSIVESIEGWLSEPEQLALLHLPSQVDHLTGGIVEIGSFKGKSTIALALGSSVMSRKKRPIYAIDPFVVPPYTFFEANVKQHGLEKFIKPIKKHSNKAYKECPKTIAVLFVDGDHEYMTVKHDINHYAARVVKGGLIAFHDYSSYWPGVVKAVNELCHNNKYEFIVVYDSLLVIRKMKL